MNAVWLLGWWNLIFIVPFLLALLYLGLYTASGVSFGDADADADADLDADAELATDASASDHDFSADSDLDADSDLSADADADADADIDADGHVEASADAEADADADAEAQTHAVSSAHDASPSSALAVLSFLGIGRVPLSLWLTVWMLSWGMIGFATNQLIRTDATTGIRAASTSLPVALLGSILVTRFVTRFMNRYVPLNESYAVRRHELLGSVGEAILPINADFGLLSVRDERGELYHVPCRLQQRAEQTVIDKGRRAKLVAYNASEKIFLVIPVDARASLLPPSNSVKPTFQQKGAT